MVIDTERSRQYDIQYLFVYIDYSDTNFTILFSDRQWQRCTNRNCSFVIISHKRQ